MSKVVLDDVDRKILGFLLKNARMPFLEIARECGISGAAIHQRIKKLDELGVILGSRLIVDHKRIGFDICTYIGVKVSDSQLLTKAVENLKSIPEVVECHYITGAYSLLVKIYCRSNEHLMKIIFDGILHIEGLSSTETMISLREAFQREVGLDSLSRDDI